MSDSVYVGLSVEDLDIGQEAAPVSKVVLTVDSGNQYTVGDDTGKTITVSVPWGSRAMAERILQSLQSYRYQPYTGKNAIADPAVEVGDAVIIGDIMSTVVQKNVTFGRLTVMDLSAPATNEIEDEYPYKSKAQRTSERKEAQTRAAIEKSAEEVRVYVKDEVDGALAEVDVKLDSIKLEVSQETGEDGKVYARLTLTVGPNQYSGLIMIEGNLDVSGQISADALYAALGDIADLTVNRLSTSRRIVLYLKRDDSDDNYVRIQDQYIELVTGTTDGSTEQATTPTGLALYWEDDPDGEGVSLGTDGYPYKGGQRIFTTTKVTDWPVWVYVYDEQIKRSIGFEMLDGIYTPVDYFGHGDGKGGSRGRLLKSKTGLELLYTTSTSRGSKELGLKAGDGGYLDLYGLRRTTALDFSGWEYGSFRENVEGLSETLTYSVDFDEEGRPIRITDDGDNVMTIQW